MSDEQKPVYYEHPVIDQLMDIVLKLGAEVWVSRDRQRVIEYLLEHEGTVTAKMIETFEPSPEWAEAMNAEREAFIKRVYGELYAALKDVPGGRFQPGVDTFKDP